MLRRLQFRAEALIAGLVLRLLGFLGPETASNLGGTLGGAIGPLLPVSRVADQNLRLALPALDREQRRHIIRGVWENLGRTVGELPHIARLNPTEAGPGWEVRGAEHLRALAAAGGPAILFSGHIGNWEVLPAATARFGIFMATFYRPAANPLVDAMIVRLREDARGRSAPQFAKGSQGARQALAYLGQKGFLGMLVDQKMNDGIAVPFFDHMAMTAPAAAVFALRHRCPVIPGHVERLGPARFRLICEPPLSLPDSGDRHADIATLTRVMNACLERWITERPESWLWLHRRWPKQAE